MKLTKEIINVASIDPNCEFAIVNNKVYDLKVGQNILDTYERLTYISCFGTNHLIIKNKRGYSFIINKETLSIEETKKINSFSFPYVQFYTKTEPRLYSLYNYVTKEIKFETENWIGRNIIKEHIIGEHNKLITFRTIYSSDIIWKFPLNFLGTFRNNWQEEKPYEVKKFIGIWNNQLIVQLTGGRFIGLDTETGALLWDINEVKNNRTKQEIDYGFGDPYNPFLDEKTGRIYMLQGENLIDFDLNELEASYVWSSKDNQPENNLFIRQSRMYDGKIYFTARSHINNVDDMVGVFDLEENKIVWRHIFNFEKGAFIPNSQDNIQVNNKNLLVLDNKGVLYVFERK